MYDIINDFVNTYKESVRSHLKRHDKSLHAMYDAINAISNLAGAHKQFSDKLEERIIILEEYIKLLEEEACQQMKK